MNKIIQATCLVLIAAFAIIAVAAFFYTGQQNKSLNYYKERKAIYDANH